MADRVFNWPVRVYYEDTDAGGIVYYVNYLKFMERARTEYLRSLGFDQQALMHDGILFVVRNTAIEYLKPARLDDALDVTVSLSRRGRAGFDMVQSIWRDGEELCKSRVSIACVSANSLKPVGLPVNIRQAMLLSSQDAPSDA
ncbi:tol-pal system-associated acyl-CoA thioesterase [Parendozoicomonas haliclonae]|uniref:Acyl-CoA thioester hydrolase YbgC n=1 Tax=Parendozoicomonas haliclonae TaxID=1960125 RepID=A0A1X7AHM8_9GAMM|nr:tol-pal system-associated acyl-CoA thioesterase [Parendozoicomonas haliclonae]SMA36471.1 Acyl-CoA thioester hydrolase YbgC [Parendozoicomonas haliclonae]